jgi:hypothetical protein
MAALGKGLLVLLGIAFVAAGFVAFFCYGQLDELTKVGQGTPHAMSLAELVEKGPGTNAHVQLSDFTFGPAVIEEKEGPWKGVWLPLVPATPLKQKAGPVVLWSGRISSQEELQEFVKQLKVDVLCVAKLSDTSTLRVRPGKTYRAAHPDYDASKATVLAEPAFVLPGGRVLRADILFDPQIPQRLGWVGFGGLVLGGLCLWRGFRTPRTEVRRTSKRKKKGARPTPPAPAEAYARLAREQELGRYPFSWQQVFMRMFQRGGCLLFGLFGACFFLYLAGQAWNDHRPELLGLFVVLSGVLCFLGFYLTFMSVGALFQGISEFIVHSSGIRWQKGSKTHAALWEDIAEVYRAEVRCFRRGQMTNTFSTMTVKLYDGQVLKMSADTYVCFEALAQSVESAHGGCIAAVKHRELVEEGEATFGVVTLCRDGLILHGTFYPWEKLGDYETENGRIHFYHRGAFFATRTTIPVRSIPNCAALLTLLADMHQVIRGRRTVTV